MIDLSHSRNLAVRVRAGCFHVLFLLPVLIAGLGFIPAGRVAAQTFTTMHSFTGGSDGTFGGGLIVSGNILYGTTDRGGSGNGSIFAISTGGTAFTNLYSFSGTNSDGWSSNGLILA